MKTFQFRKSLYLPTLILGLAVLMVALAPHSAVAKTEPRANPAARAARPATASTGAAAVFGIDDGGVAHQTPETINLAAGTGANWERISLWWKNLEPTEGVYEWTPADESLNPLLAAGFSLIVYIDKNPTWAANTECGPVYENKRAAFAKLYTELATRYPGVKIWAAYNEIDFDADISKNTGGCFGARTPGGVDNNGQADYIDYALMLRDAWQAVHQANPNARFAMGAMAYDNFNEATYPKNYPGKGKGGLFNYNFAPSLFAYMKNNSLPINQKYMDLVLLNYYNLYGTFFWSVTKPALGFQAKVKALRKLMSDAGIPVVPLFVTETGEDSSPANEGGITLAGQARCLSMTLVRGAANRLEGVIWWTFRDHTAAQAGWNYGVVNMDLTRKRSYHAFQALATELNGYSYERAQSNKTGFINVEAYRFGGAAGKKYVVWSASATSASNSECAWARAKKMASFKAKTLRIVNGGGVLNKSGAVKVTIIKDGTRKDKNPAPGIVGVNVGADPLIVQINP